MDLSTIPINQITHVEIVRGPLSVFYGSEAMAGAINLVTEILMPTSPGFVSWLKVDDSIHARR